MSRIEKSIPIESRLMVSGEYRREYLGDTKFLFRVWRYYEIG